jgi:hypothetical protein
MPSGQVQWRFARDGWQELDASGRRASEIARNWRGFCPAVDCTGLMMMMTKQAAIIEMYRFACQIFRIQSVFYVKIIKVEVLIKNSTVLYACLVWQPEVLQSWSDATWAQAVRALWSLDKRTLKAVDRATPKMRVDHRVPVGEDRWNATVCLLPTAVRSGGAEIASKPGER